MNRKISTTILATLLVMSVNTVFAQQGDRPRPDPKTMSAKAAEKLEFTDVQKAKLAALNEKYPGADYDRRKYHEEFRKIMTDEQREKADAMRKVHRRDMRGHDQGNMK
ncbi:MAG: hypothetical protein H6550_05250 [Chitinophagales bacterium]|nr:hypothetical protein [Chitinophagales bacterium]